MAERFGIPIAQTENQIDMFFKLIEQYNVTTFIELGVYMGGLSDLMLRYKADHEDFKYLGFDFNYGQIHSSMRDRPEIFIMDIFSNQCYDKVREAINTSSGTAFVFCDGGNKPKELETYSHFLRVGDLIQAHDYPGEITDAFLDGFGANHPEYKELWPKNFRAKDDDVPVNLRVENGASLWIKIR